MSEYSSQSDTRLLIINKAENTWLVVYHHIFRGFFSSLSTFRLLRMVPKYSRPLNQVCSACHISIPDYSMKVEHKQNLKSCRQLFVISIQKREYLHLFKQYFNFLFWSVTILIEIVFPSRLFFLLLGPGKSTQVQHRVFNGSIECCECILLAMHLNQILPKDRLKRCIAIKQRRNSQFKKSNLNTDISNNTKGRELSNKINRQIKHGHIRIP